MKSRYFYLLATLFEWLSQTSRRAAISCSASPTTAARHVRRAEACALEAHRLRQRAGELQ